jgi:hypothetical protein
MPPRSYGQPHGVHIYAHHLGDRLQSAGHSTGSASENRLDNFGSPRDAQPQRTELICGLPSIAPHSWQFLAADGPAEPL